MTANPFDPHPEKRMAALAALRSACPVAALGENGPFLALAHAPVADGFKRVDEFGGSAGQQGLDDDEKTIAGMLEPRHGQVRRIINAVVAFHKSQKIEPYLEALAEELLDRILGESAATGPEGLDVMPLFAEPIPPRAMAALLGFPPEDADRYYAWADQLGVAFAAAVAEGRPISMIDACPDMAEYVMGHIERRQATPADEWPNDAVSRFLTTDVDGERLSPRAICIQIMFMIGAGSETTRGLLGNLLFRLAQEPDLYERVRRDPSLVDALVEEALRMDAPAQFMVRRCLHGGTLGGVDLDEGAQVMLAIAAANHDPEVFPNPERFDVDRGSRDHLSFGHGPHVCPGAALARLEARTAMQAFVRRVGSFRLAAGYEFDHAPTGMLHGPKTLRLVVEPAAAL
jgi:cytochrome P450